MLRGFREFQKGSAGDLYLGVMWSEPNAVIVDHDVAVMRSRWNMVMSGELVVSESLIYSAQTTNKFNSKRYPLLRSGTTNLTFVNLYISITNIIMGDFNAHHPFYSDLVTNARWNRRWWKSQFYISSES